MKPSPEELCDDLILLFGRFKQRLIHHAEQHGLTPVQLGALHSLYRHGDLVMGQVALVLHCDASNVTGIVDRLVAQGFVVRKELPHDRRAKTLHLTEKGLRIVEMTRRGLSEEIGLDLFTPDECRLLHKLAVGP